MKDYKISLIIPAYNEEKYLGGCLDFAIKNSHNKFLEIIVVDNASTDNTKSIALSRPNVRVIMEREKGVTRARQRGYLESKGDILAYIDADTRMPEGWVDTIIEEFGNNKNLVCLSGPYIYYDLPKYQQFLVKMYWYILALPMYWIVGYMVIGGNFAIKKDILAKTGGFDTTIEFYGDDTNTARRASKFGKVKFKIDNYMYTSGRRLVNQGIMYMFKEYGQNFLSEVLFKKPVTKEYKDFR